MQMESASLNLYTCNNGSITNVKPFLQMVICQYLKFKTMGILSVIPV